MIINILRRKFKIKIDCHDCQKISFMVQLGGVSRMRDNFTDFVLKSSKTVTNFLMVFRKMNIFGKLA